MQGIELVTVLIESILKHFQTVIKVNSSETKYYLLE